MNTVSPIPGHPLWVKVGSPPSMPDEEQSYEIQNRRGTTTSGMGRFDVSSYEYFSTRIEAVNDRLTAQLAFQRELIQTQFLAAQEAIKKSEESSDKRFASVNEFRAQLADQATRFASKESLDAWTRESRTAHENFSKEIQRAVDVAHKALAEHTIRDDTHHQELSDRITREVAELRKQQYQPGAEVAVTSALDSRVKALEAGVNQYRGRDVQKVEGAQSIQWGVVLGVSIVNVLAVVLVHYLR